MRHSKQIRKLQTDVAVLQYRVEELQRHIGTLPPPSSPAGLLVSLPLSERTDDETFGGQVRQAANG